MEVNNCNNAKVQADSLVQTGNGSNSHDHQQLETPYSKMEIDESANNVSQSLTLRQFWAILLRDKLNLTYTLLIFLNQFFYVSVLCLLKFFLT